MGIFVSVIVPVYNAARYLAQAVESALAQPETSEVILVEDGSPDNSLEVCQALSQKYEKVRLFQHPGGSNRGAAPSRNLGIEKSTCPYLAFLDADDYYQPGRFDQAGKIFQSDPDCDGVYEAVGIYFENEQGRERWLASNMAAVELTTIKAIVPPADLFKVLIKGSGLGHIHLNGLVVRRSLLEKSGVMNEKIADTLHEDTDFVLKVAAVGKLLPGSLDRPVAMRRVHAENRVSSQRPPSKIYRDLMRQKIETYRWCKSKKMGEHSFLVFKRMLGDYLRDKPQASFITKLPARISDSVKLSLWPLEFPEALLEGYYWLELLRSAWAILRAPLTKKTIS